MATGNAPGGKGRESERAYREETRKEERKIEAEKGSDLKKGASRVEERSRSSDGNGVEPKQRE